MFLNNTRSVARAHYVHPHVLEAYRDGTFEDVLREKRPVRSPLLDQDERALVSFLGVLLVRHVRGF